MLSLRYNSLIQSVFIFISLSILFTIAFGTIYVELFILEGNVGESSPVEWAQELLLSITSLIFFNLAYHYKNLKYLGILVGSFFVCLLIRELDSVFDNLIHGFWKYPAWIVAISAIGYCSTSFKTTIYQLNEYSKHVSFGLMLGGAVSLLVFSRLFGMGILWQEVMGDNYVRGVKNLVEEGVELMCYIMIFCSSVWYWLTEKYKSNKINS